LGSFLGTYQWYLEGAAVTVLAVAWWVFLREKKQLERLAAVAAALSLALGGVAFAGERTVNLKILGMNCGMCPPAAEKALKGVAGVKSVSVKTTICGHSSSNGAGVRLPQCARAGAT
jgi:hypothetical protein